MDDLIKQITDKTGISMDQAKGAIEQVMNFLGDKLPGPIASQVKQRVVSQFGNLCHQSVDVNRVQITIGVDIKGIGWK